MTEVGRDETQVEPETFEDGVRTGYVLAAWVLRRLGLTDLSDSLIEQSRSENVYPEGYLRPRAEK